MERFGIIGLGRMGAAIAKRFAEQGHAVLGWTRSGRGVESVESAADLETLVSASDVLILSLFDDEAVSDVLDALLSFELAGKLIIETSTVSPGVLEKRTEQIEASGGQAVDAPISGGPELVAAGQCGVFIGGSDEAAARATQSLEAISNRIFHVGPLGTGLVMKVINNGMIQTYVAGLAELLPMARRAGLSLEVALKILCGGPAGMPLVTARIPKILGEDNEVGFSLDGAFKDNEMFQQVVKSYGLTPTMLARFGEHRDDIAEAGLLEHDPAAMISRAYER